MKTHVVKFHRPSHTPYRVVFLEGEEGTRIYFENLEIDCLGRESWRKETKTETIASILAVAVSDLLKGPSWVAPSATRIHRSIKPLVRVETFSCGWQRAPYGSIEKTRDEWIVRLIHERFSREQESDSHFSFIETREVDHLGDPRWVPVWSSMDTTGIMTHLVENYITLSGMRYGDQDHRQGLYLAESEPATS